MVSSVEPVADLVDHHAVEIDRLACAVGPPPGALVEPAARSVVLDHPQDEGHEPSCPKVVRGLRQQSLAEASPPGLGGEVDRMDLPGSRLRVVVARRPRLGESADLPGLLDDPDSGLVRRLGGGATDRPGPGVATRIDGQPIEDRVRDDPAIRRPPRTDVQVGDGGGVADRRLADDDVDQAACSPGSRSPARIARSRRFSGGASGQAQRGSKAHDG